MDRELKKQNIGNFLKKAEKSLAACKILHKQKLFEDSLSKSYYVYLYFAKALLVSKGIIVKSHKAAGNQFALHFVRTGIMDKKYSGYFSMLSKKRLLVDYEEVFFVSQILADEAMAMVNEFRKEVCRVLKK